MIKKTQRWEQNAFQQGLLASELGIRASQKQPGGGRVRNRKKKGPNGAGQTASDDPAITAGISPHRAPP